MRSLSDKAKYEKLGNTYEISHDTLMVESKMQKLVEGNSYCLFNEGEWRKLEYLGATGFANSLLRFRKKIKRFSKIEFYKECFQKNDYLQNRLKILTKDEYKEMKRKELWEKVANRADKN